jgi:hypothetical protein
MKIRHDLRQSLIELIDQLQNLQNNPSVASISGRFLGIPEILVVTVPEELVQKLRKNAENNA